MKLEDQRARLDQLIADAGLSESAAAITGAVRESLRLFPEPATDATHAVGASRFGGAADLPSADAWPHHAGHPLVFIAQIRLDEVAGMLADNPLPTTGLLSFFAFDLLDGEPGDPEPSDEAYDAYGNAGAVLYAATTDDLVSVDPPYGDELRHIDCHAIRFVPELCIPPVEGPDFDRMGLDDNSAYWDDVWMNRAFFGDEPFHRLLGHPDMNFNYHMKGTRLLLQLCADDDIGWEFGDAQDLRFLIPPAALAEARFDAVTVNGDLE